MTSARDWIRSRCPEALAAFEQAGAQTLADYAAGFGADAALPRPPQAADDLVELAAATCARLYSPDLGQALRRELESDLHALTANHHGVDFHPEFFQGDLLFAMSCRHAVPLFNCGAVPANNVAYPRGILLGCGTPEEVSFRSRKLPILPGMGSSACARRSPPPRSPCPRSFPASRKSRMLWTVLSRPSTAIPAFWDSRHSGIRPAS